MKIKKLLSLALALCLVFGLCACGDNNADDDKGATSPQGAQQVETNDSGSQDSYISEGADTNIVAKDELIIGTTNEVTIPFDNMDNNNVNGVALCYDYLVYLDNVTGELKSDILESWEYKDTTTIELKVKDGITFSNGDPLTAEDVIWSFAERIALGLPQTDDFNNFDWDNAEIASDGLTITLKTFGEYAPGLVVLNKPIENKSEHEKHDAGDEYWWTTTCGTGPYKLVEQVDGAYAKYELRDDYWGDEEYVFKNITFKYYGEETALYIDYQNGNVDIALNLGAYSYEQLKAGAVANTVVHLHANGNYEQIHANPATTEIWNNVKFRQAVAHAIDWDNLIMLAYDGLAIPMDSIFPTNCVGYESQGGYEYDPELSRQLLKECGYDGSVSLELLARDRNSKLAEALQGMLAEVGINVQLSVVEFGVLLPKMSAGECEFLLTDINTDNLGEPSPAYTAASAEARLPSMRVSDAHWNELIAKAATIDQAARVEVLKEIQQYAHENCFYIPLCSKCEVWCFNTTVLPTDFNPYFGGISNFAVVAE